MLTPVLAHIFNLSISQGTFPDGMKKAIIVPIHKSGDKDDLSNYRPISILPLFAKLFERLMLNRIIAFIEKFNILTTRQFGFRKGRSTTEALVSVVSELQEALNNSEKSILLCIDFCKAFDTIHHGIMLEKLAHYGFRGIMQNWFNSYLSTRKQIVSIQSEFSEEKEIYFGVPQGSILGPLLFIIYINDLPNVIDYGTPTLFADDSGIVYSGNSFDCIVHHAQLDLIEIAKWATRNYLTINVNKTHYLKVSTPQSKNETHRELFLETGKIFSVNVTKFLGILIDSNCKWDMHINSVVDKISCLVGTLAYIRHFVPLSTLKLIYDSLINSKISYGIEIWGDAYKSHIKPIQTMQNRAIRHITFTNYRESVAPEYTKLKVRNITSLYKYKLSTFSHMMVKKYPANFHFGTTSRNNYNIKLPPIHNNYGLHSIIVNIIKSYNTLPVNIKMLNHGNAANKLIKKLFM